MLHAADATVAGRPSLSMAVEGLAVACEGVEVVSGRWESDLSRAQLLALQETLPAVEPWPMLGCVVVPLLLFCCCTAVVVAPALLLGGDAHFSTGLQRP